MKKKLLLNTATALAAQFVVLVIGFVLPRLILEQYGSEVNGLTQSIKQFLGIITFLELGTSQVMRSNLYRPLAGRDYAEISRIVVAGRKFYSRFAGALAVYVVILMGVYPYLADQSFGWLYTATLIGAIAISSFAQYFFGIVNEQVLHADQRGYVVYGLQIGTQILNLVVCVVLLRLGRSIQVVKLATSLIFLIRPLFIHAYVTRQYRIDKRIEYAGDPIKQKWNGMAQHISAVVLDGTDTIVLTLFSTLSNVSVYSVYYLVIGSIQQFYQAATAGIHSAAGALWAKNDIQAQKKMFSYTQMGLHLVTVFLFTCMGRLIVPFVQVYTFGLTDANYTQPLFAVVLVFAYGIRCLRTPYNIWILAAGHYKQTQRCHITAAAVNVVISVIAVAQFGLIGVAIGTLIAMLYQTTWMAVYNTKHLLHWPLSNMLKQVAVDLCIVVVSCVLCSGMVMGSVCYLSWFVLAVKVALVTLLVTVLAASLFFRKECKGLVGAVLKKSRQL